MPCVCCLPPCPITEIASTIQFKFGPSQTDTGINPSDPSRFDYLPCFSGGASLRYCPPGGLYSGIFDVNNFNYNANATSGDCAKYDGTYIVDLATERLPSSAYFRWCTAVVWDACLADRRAVAFSANGNSIAYEVSCTGATARHMKFGTGVAIEHVASLVSVSQGGTPPAPPASEARAIQLNLMPLVVVSGPDKVASDRFFDWYITRYKRSMAPNVNAFSDEVWSLLGEHGDTERKFCDFPAPEITLQ